MMMRAARILAVGSLLVCFMPARSFAKEGLFRFKGKTYTEDDVSPATRQALFDIANERYLKMQQAVENAVLEKHFEEIAKKKGKAAKDVEEDALKGKEPTDKEMRDFFDKNKSRIQAKYEDVQGEIKQYLLTMQRQTTRQKILEGLKADKSFSLMIEAPEPPHVDVKYEGYPFRGKADAKVVFVEFADYQCPHCRAAEPTVSKVVDEYKDKIRYVYIDFPINRSGISKIIAEAAVCADEQGKYWEFHKMAFEKQNELSKDSPIKFAQELKLDEGKFKKCVDSNVGKDRVAKGQEEGNRVGVGGTPTMFVNGKRLTHGYDEADLKDALNKALH